MVTNYISQAQASLTPSTEDGQNVRNCGIDSVQAIYQADQFISRLDELAWILEQEGQQ